MGMQATRRQKILDRDNWQCQMPRCLHPAGRGIDPALPPGTGWGATADHITPRSAGGTHALANLRAAHFICNQAASPAPRPNPASSPADPIPGTGEIPPLRRPKPRPQTRKTRPDPYDRIRQAERDRRTTGRGTAA